MNVCIGRASFCCLQLAMLGLVLIAVTLASSAVAQELAPQGSEAGSAGDSGEHEADSDQVIGFSGMAAHIRRLERGERLVAAGYCGCDDNPVTSACVVVLTAKECRQISGPGPRSDRSEELYAESFPLIMRKILIQRGLIDPLKTDDASAPDAAQGLRDSTPVPE